MKVKAPRMFSENKIVLKPALIKKLIALKPALIKKNWPLESILQEKKRCQQKSVF
jgi:hypothetical protein